jgi:anaerobic C4-dicarboxylate transporter
MLLLELVVVLICIFAGARLGGIALGTSAGIGLVILVFILGLPPGMPPRTVLGMILAVVTAASTMQAAGGLDYLVTLAERALRIWPAGITIVAPIVAYVFTFAAAQGISSTRSCQLLRKFRGRPAFAPSGHCPSRRLHRNRRSPPPPSLRRQWP